MDEILAVGGNGINDDDVGEVLDDGGADAVLGSKEGAEGRRKAFLELLAVV